MTPAEAYARRQAEHACALDFLVYGDDEEHGPHAERCVHARCIHCGQVPTKGGPCPELLAATREHAARWVDKESPHAWRQRLAAGIARAAERIADNLVPGCQLDPGSVCAREYDPMPYAEAEPLPGFHDGTGIAALYGLPGGDAHAWQLAGWNVRKEPKS